MIEILSLGAGVQSSAVMLMSIHGDLPKLDHVIFADTGWEPAAVYEQLEMLKKEAKKAGLPFHVVSGGNIREDSIASQNGRKRFASMPTFMKNPDGSQGISKRQCTSEYKIAPIETFIRREILGIKPRCHAPKKPVVRQWIGISLDEMQRGKPSLVKWKTHWFPLIEKRIRREGCQQWLVSHGYERAPRSACIGCPFHGNAEWLDMKRKRPEEFADACEFDELNRKPFKMKGEVYTHRQLVPLNVANIGEDQMSLWDDECDGMCGI